LNLNPAIDFFLKKNYLLQLDIASNIYSFKRITQAKTIGGLVLHYNIVNLSEQLNQQQSLNSYG
jgi:hypothetical protein